jgi:hypothetical protein
MGERRARTQSRPLVRSAVIAALATVAGSAPARAQEDPRPREAKAACAAGDVQRGIALLADLYAETNDMAWVFNQGRCYQQNGQLESAINRFREYLRRPARTTPEMRDEAEAFIVELEAQLRDRPADRARAGGGSGTPTTDAAGASPATDTQALDAGPLPLSPETAAAATTLTGDPTQARASAPPAGGGRGLLVGSAVLGGTGVVALAVAIVSSTRIRALEKEVSGWSAQAAGTHSVSDWKDRQITGDLHEKIQWVGYGVAALTLAGSATFLFLASRRASEVSLLPALHAGGGGATLSVAF